MILSTGFLIYLAILAVIAFGAFAIMRSDPPTHGPLGDLYELQPMLHPAKIAVIAVFIAGLFAKAGLRTGALEPELFSQIQSVGRLVLVFALLVFVSLLAQAGLKSWRQSNPLA
ncbi:MAG: hypothetical protein ACT4N2_00745 [Hyphomicrobium sp.]